MLFVPVPNQRCLEYCRAKFCPMPFFTIPLTDRSVSLTRVYADGHTFTENMVPAFGPTAKAVGINSGTIF